MTLLNYKLYNSKHVSFKKIAYARVYQSAYLELTIAYLESMVPQFQHYTSSGYVYFKKFVSGKYTEKYDKPICL
jgi:hypothetical protein